MAMAHGLPIVSTPTHHALELLYDSRGLLVHYNDNGTALAEALIALLHSGSLQTVMVSRSPNRLPWKLWALHHEILRSPARNVHDVLRIDHRMMTLARRCSTSVQGARAQQMVHDWTWQKVAMQYAKLMLEGNATLLGADPFHDAQFEEPSAFWHGQDIRTLSGLKLSAGSLPQSFQRGCMHALYVDIDIQACHTTLCMPD